ncbi:MAG: hypothetical protein QOJ92_729 [Frankiales bacterium]|nr:hypothetical protein [Frankiales bacterium]
MSTTDLGHEHAVPELETHSEVLDAGEEQAARRAPAVRRDRRRNLLIGVTLAFVGYLIVFGPPSGREIVLMWVLAWLFAVVGGSWALFRRVVLRDWMPLIAVLFVYDFLRGQVERMPWSDSLPLLQDNSFTPHLWHAHVLPVLRGDVDVFGQLPTAWLQHHLHPTDAFHWYDYALAVVYMSHFIVPLLVALLLWTRSYHAFHRYVATLTTLSVMGLATYLTFPAAPPWLASVNGWTTPGVQRLMGEALKSAGSTPARSVIERGEAWSNPVAAMPSLHAAMPMMILLFFWGAARWWMRGLLALYTLAMGFALVYGGEHYVIDIVFGWAYAALAWLAVRRVVAWRRRRASARQAVSTVPIAAAPVPG